MQEKKRRRKEEKRTPLNGYAQWRFELAKELPSFFTNRGIKLEIKV
jgi:hypothetical protein